ncbi:MAG: IclR family transcriptional regulator [Betaproteobacteria bacterium]|jgi:DNA-binding IclR family transcriptional regulator|nr:IclR family transcriptional regulator [Betaproteobacteria bacterium]MBK9703945.1 IclR family transcriptional regulator [Betaproteobacteria bacterium]
MLPYNDKNGTSFNDLSVGNRRGGPTQAAPRGRAGRGIRIDHRVAIVKKSLGTLRGNAPRSEKINTGVDKTLNILEFVAQQAKGLSLADIAKGVGMPKTTAHRILEILAARDYVEWNPDSEKYTLGLKALEIGVSGLVGIDIVDVAIPYLQELSTATGETSFLGVYNNGDVVYLYKAEGTGSIQTTARLGSRRPAYCTALGKVILANLPVEEADRVLENKLVRITERTVVDRVKLNEEFARARSDGYAVDDEGIEVGLYCLAVPLYNYTGAVVGAISVSGPSKRMLAQRDSTIVALKHAGEVISRRLGHVKSVRARLLNASHDPAPGR